MISYDVLPGLALVCGLAWLACGDGASGPSELDVIGEYTLTHVEADTVPRTICTTPDQVRQIRAGELSLNDDMSYQMSIVYQLTSGNTTVRTTLLDVGSFTVDRSEVRLESTAPNSVWSGTATDSNVNLDVEIPSECGVDTFDLGFRRNEPGAAIS